MAFNSSTNYAAEIQKAIASGASSDTVAALNAARNEKIAANQSYYNSKGISSGDSFAADAYVYTNKGNTAASSTQNSNMATTSDLSDYLKDMYAAQTESSLAALKSTYDQNAADLKSEAAKIPQTYYAAKNDAASQSELQKQAFNEYAATRGLNTGTSGQAALASSSALQGNLANINTQQANALSNNALEQQKLAAQYSAAVNQAEASGNSALASALYQEYVRQADAATTAQENAQTQANWEKQYQLSVDQNTASAASESKQYAYNLAMSMLEAGVMPDSATLAAAGISADNATAIKNATLQAASVKKSAAASSPSTKPTLTAAQTLSAIENGILSDTVLSAYKYYYGQDYNASSQSDKVYVSGKGYVSAEQAEQWLVNHSIVQTGYDTNGNPRYTVLNTGDE